MKRDEKEDGVVDDGLEKILRCYGRICPDVRLENERENDQAEEWQHTRTKSEE